MASINAPGISWEQILHIHICLDFYVISNQFQTSDINLLGLTLLFQYFVTFYLHSLFSSFLLPVTLRRLNLCHICHIYTYFSNLNAELTSRNRALNLLSNICTVVVKKGLLVPTLCRVRVCTLPSHHSKRLWRKWNKYFTIVMVGCNVKKPKRYHF